MYLRVPRARNDKKDPELQDLSETLRLLPIHGERPDPNRFRNLNSVYLKLQNFKAIDPEYTARGLTGLTAGGTRREQAVWDPYATTGGAETSRGGDSSQRRLTRGPGASAPR